MASALVELAAKSGWSSPLGRQRDAQSDRERIARGGLRRIDLVTAFLSERELHFRIELVRPAYIFTYTRLPARQIVPVTVVTKNANAIPIFLFVC